MQVAAMNPAAVDRESVSQSTIEKELEIAKEKFRLEGKPEAMLDKIAQGALQKFFKDSTLLEQDFIKDSKLTVKQYLKSIDKSLTVRAFERYGIDA
jgi:elongation factor Ts